MRELFTEIAKYEQDSSWSSSSTSSSTNRNSKSEDESEPEGSIKVPDKSAYDL